jgi:hypothetical protein
LGRIPSGFYFEFAKDVVQTASVFSWVPVPILGPENDGIRREVDAADSYSMTSSALLIKNVTAKEFRGGASCACQLPLGDDWRLPGNPTDIYNYISNLPDSQNVARFEDFKDGLHGCFIPLELLDWQWKREHLDTPWDDEFAQMPNSYFVFQVPSVLQSQVAIVMELLQTMELQTTSLTNVQQKGMSDPHGLMRVLVQLLSAEKHFGENPKHFERMRKVARKVANHPATKAILGTMIKEGIPLLLSAMA